MCAPPCKLTTGRQCSPTTGAGPTSVRARSTWRLCLKRAILATPGSMPSRAWVRASSTATASATSGSSCAEGLKRESRRPDGQPNVRDRPTARSKLGPWPTHPVPPRLQPSREEFPFFGSNHVGEGGLGNLRSGLGHPPAQRRRPRCANHRILDQSLVDGTLATQQKDTGSCT
jgi:hypothetical protein